MYFKLPIAIVFIFCCIVFVMLLQGQSEHPVARPVENVKAVGTDMDVAEFAISEIKDSDLQAHLEFLADDLLEGRDTGSRGARLASMYIATQFERYGLSGAGEKGTYFQTVPLSEYRVKPESAVLVEVDGEMIPLKYMDDFVVTGMSNGTPATYELTYAGFGIKADEYDYDDYAGLDVAGKAAVYVSGEPKSDDEAFFEGEKRTRYSSGREKRKAAEKAGAGGSLGVVRKDQLTAFPWERLQGFLTRPRVRLSQPDDSGSVPELPSVLVHADAAELIFAGSGHSYSDIDQEATAGKTTTFAMQKKVTFDIRFDKRDFNDRNVVGFLEGSDEELKSELIVFSAHYDHVGIGRPVAGDSIYNGAADNASGVSGLLELAEALSSLPKAPKRSLLFLAVTAEEKGLLGSRYYVAHPFFPLAQTAANFNLDMLGISDTTGIVVYGIDRSTLGEPMRRAAARFGLQIYPDDMPEQRIFYRSDHYNFAVKGVPTIYPSYGVNRQTMPEVAKYYHRPSDDPGLQALNYRLMQRHVQMVFQAALWVANADDSPQWHAGDEFEKIRMQQK